MKDTYVDANGIRLHLIESGDQAYGVPLLCIAGGLGTAEIFEETLAAIAPHPGVALTKRGNGKSDKPGSGYSLETQAADLLGAIEELRIDRVVILAYSAAVPSAILATNRQSERVAGLILCDYPAIYPSIPRSYVEAVTGDADYDPEECPPHVLEALSRESERRELDDLLPGIPCPVLIMHGIGEGTYLKQEALQAYLEHLPNARAVGFEGGGHGFIETQFEAFADAVRSFLAEVGA